MKIRYFIELSYAGTNYSGWQFQPNGISVQQVLNERFSLKLRENIEITGAGRTDTGVHATYFVAHFETDKKLNASFVGLMNKFLPDDIVIHKIFEVNREAHARFSAVSRTYEYRISKVKNPFLNDFVFRYSKALDLKRMNNAAELLLKTSDFTSFSKLHSDNKTNLCNVTYARWEETEDMYVFTITANRFLRNMVRAIVGTLLDVGKHKIDLVDFRAIIEKKNRQKAGSSAPAKGLFLTKIEYPEDIYP